jgi:hypothetical protein
MLPRKTGKPIAIKCTEQFREQTEAIADSLGKSISDYCRIAIENYNKHYQQHEPSDSTHNIASKPEEDDIPNPKREIKPLPITPFKGVTSTSKPQMVQSYMKGEKK